MEGVVSEYMKISVLLPVYNAGLPLRLAIESILGQELKEFEFLIIDDASTDSSAEIIREYARNDSRVHATYHTSNQGLARTLNEGLHLASGDLVVRMDQDDESLPHRLWVQHLYMKTHPEVVVAGSYFFRMGIKRQKDRLIRLPTAHAEIVETFKHENCICHPSVIMRRQSILGLGGYRAQFRNAEDYDLWLRVSRTYQLANIPVPLVRYRYSMAGMSLTRKWEQLYYFLLAQAAQQDSLQPFSACEEATRKRLEQTDRSVFMTMVAGAEAEELARLGYFGDSVRLLRHFAGEIGTTSSITIAWGLLRKLGPCT
jgi:GT2 family glycosyltransferase